MNTNLNAPKVRPVVFLMYIMTFTTGIIDAITILGLGDIFASLMTGNIVFMGLGLGGFEEVTPSRNAWALVMFILGSVLAGYITKKFVKRKVGTWLLLVASIEVILLLGAAWTTWDIGPEDPLHPLSFQVIIAIGLTSFAMGLRNSTILRLSISDLKVTVLTLAISGLGADLGSGNSESQKQIRRLGSIVLIAAGAAFGAWLFFQYGVAFPLVVVALIVALATYVFSRTKEAGLTPAQLSN